MTGSPSLLSGCLQPCSMHPSTGEGFLLGFIPLPSDTLCKGFGCQGSHEPTHCSTITAGAASCCRKGFVLWHRVCHCCDTWGQPCPAVLSHMGPASGMLCGTLCSSITGVVPSALLPYPAQQTLCPARVSDWVLVLYLPDVGVEWGVPCGCFSFIRSAWSGPWRGMHSPGIPKTCFMVHCKAFFFFAKHLLLVFATHLH